MVMIVDGGDSEWYQRGRYGATAFARSKYNSWWLQNKDVYALNKTLRFEH